MTRAVLVPLLAASATLAWVAPSLADPNVDDDGTVAGNVEQARTLFNEARTLAAEALYAEACPRFEESLKLEPRISTEFNLAECWEHLERTASAHALFLRVADATHQSGDLEREKIARRRAEMLEPRLCAIEVDVPSGLEGLEVQHDSMPLSAAELGTAIPVDPGTIEVRAQAPGKKSWLTRVDVQPCPTLVTVQVPELEAEPTHAAVPVTPEKPPESGKQSAGVTAEEANNGAKPRSLILPITLGAFGTGAIVGGLIFAGQYKTNNDNARAICSGSATCPASEIKQHSHYVQSAKDARTWAYLGFGVGTAAIAGAAILYLTGEPATSSTTDKGWSAAPLVTETGNAWGAALRRAF